MKFFLDKVIIFLLVVLAATPLVVVPSFLYPHVLGKIFFIRAIIEVTVLLAVARFFSGNNKQAVLLYLKNPLFISIVAYLLSALVSTAFAVNAFRAFWGDIERGGGFFSLLHYAAFLILTLVFFRKKEWMIFLKVVLLSGGIVIFYTVLQYFNIQNFPFAFPMSGRPGSFFDNPAFLAEYLILLSAFSILLFGYSDSPRIRRVSGIIGTFSLVALLMTGSRGALVGVLSGAVFVLIILSYRGDAARRLPLIRLSTRRVALSLLLLFGVFGSVFWLTKGEFFWQEIPGVNRLAELGVTDSSAQTRLIALRSSWEGFKERPLFGWGLENFNVAYNKHYNPDYALYEEGWFDQAHNKIAEVGVTQGITGLGTYLVMLGALLFLIVKGKLFSDLNGGATLRLLLAGSIVAYFIQNLFLFDTPVSHLFLFGIFGIGLFSLRGAHSEELRVDGKKIQVILASFGVVLAILSAFVLYLYVLVPAYQLATYRDVVSARAGERVLEVTDRFLSPYTFIQSDLRFAFTKIVSDPVILHNPSFAPLIEKAVAGMEELAEREANYDPRNFIILAELYNEGAKDNRALFARAEEYARRALVLSPKRQDIYYVLAFSLAGQGRFDDAIQTMRDAVALNPGVAKAHYNLGVELALAGEKHWDEAEGELARAQDIGFVMLLPEDVNNMSTIYKEMLYAYIMGHDAVRVVRVAERFKKLEPDLAQDMDTIISLAKSSDWKTLIKAVEESSQGD